MKRLPTALFVFCFFMPLLTLFCFYTGLLKGSPMFDTLIEEPVAKIVTPKGVGTGFLVSPTKVLTARHVVEGVNGTIQVMFDKAAQPRTVSGKVKYVAPSNVPANPNGTVPLNYFLTDLAIIEIPPVSDITPLDLGDSDAVNPLDEIILVGYPGGDYSITKGNINSDSYQGQNLFKLDASSNPGNSGSPCILADDNSVIGILVGGATMNSQGENVALKVSDIKSLLKTARVSLSE